MSAPRFQFDPELVARCEVDGWKAYENRAWPRMFWGIKSLAEVQFHIPNPQSVGAAYHIVRASIAWQPAESDRSRVAVHLRRFYTLAHTFSGLQFDVDVVSQLEVQYWDVHRRLMGKADKSEFVHALTQLHQNLFQVDPSAAVRSALLRVEANNVRDTIIGMTSLDPPRDWTRCESLLRQCYHTLASSYSP